MLGLLRLRRVDEAKRVLSAGLELPPGYAIAWSGWDATVESGRNRLTITAPIARNPDGSSIVGPALEEFVIQNGTLTKGALTYAAADLDKSKASLTVRDRHSNHPAPVQESGWEYQDEHTIQLLPPGTSFIAAFSASSSSGMEAVITTGLPDLSSNASPAWP